MTTQERDYRAEFLSLGVTIEQVAETTGCPPWCAVMPSVYKRHHHGPQYQTKISRGGAEVEVTTWGSEYATEGPRVFDLLFDLWWGDYVTRHYPTIEEFLEFHTEYEKDEEAGKMDFAHQKGLSAAFDKLFPTVEDKMKVAELVGLKGHMYDYKKDLGE